MNSAKQGIRNLIAIAAVTLALTGCGSVFDDLPPCPSGARVRFIYDYNLESANAFHSRVDCVTLHVYDSTGTFVTTVTETSDAMADESWRMNLNLPAGRYHAVAYGGIACDEASFAHVAVPAPGSHVGDIMMALDPQHIGRRLHDHYHGTADFEISDNTPEPDEVTVRLTKNTNHFRILLQQLDGSPVNGSDFTFSIRDDNTLLDASNATVAGHPAVYQAWARGQVSAADMATLDSRAEVLVGYGELSTSRLCTGNDTRLVIATADDGREVVSLPLQTYLLMSMSDADLWGDQEYLDRCSRWNMTFFLDRNNQWSQTRIIINGWVVRINNTDL